MIYRVKSIRRDLHLLQYRPEVTDRWHLYAAFGSRTKALSERKTLQALDALLPKLETDHDL